MTIQKRTKQRAAAAAAPRKAHRPGARAPTRPKTKKRTGSGSAQKHKPSPPPAAATKKQKKKIRPSPVTAQEEQGQLTISKYFIPEDDQDDGVMSFFPCVNQRLAFISSLPPRTPLAPSKFLVLGIDLGSRKMGFCSLPLNYAEDPQAAQPWIHMEESDLLRPKDGRVYNEYQEGLAMEMLRTWIHERREYFRHAALVTIEKSLTDMSSKTARTCLYLEALFTGILDAKIPDNGPLYLITSPTQVKKACHIETGNHEIMEEFLEETGGRFAFFNPKHKAIMNQTRLENKKRAIRHFWEMHSSGHPFVRHLAQSKQCNTASADAIDAFFEAMYAYTHFPALVDRARVTSHHNRDASGRTRIPTKERRVPLPHLF